VENSYKILGLKIGATLDEVEEKYKQLLKEFDPEKQSEDLKEFFSVECNKVKEAYKEISLSLINSDNVEQVVDEINSDTSEIDSENEDLVTSPIKELIDDSQENKLDMSSVNLERYLKLKRVCLIMFILFFLFSLYGWSSFSTLKDDKVYWYNSYKEIKSEVSGDDYDSGCNKRKALKIHLKIFISYKKKNGEWSSWGYWSFNAGLYNGIRSDDEEYNSGTIYTSDYRYYIETMNYNPYLYSKDVPHITNTCNAKCINIY
jgi:hypothetical protein